MQIHLLREQTLHSPKPSSGSISYHQKLKYLEIKRGFHLNQLKFSARHRQGGNCQN